MGFLTAAEHVYPLIPSVVYNERAATVTNTRHQEPTGMENISRPDAVATQSLALIEAIKQQDEDALAQLYDLTVDRVYSLAMTMTGNSDDAEEVVGDVYLKVWQRAAQYQAERGQVISWLLVTCRSAALDLLRRRQRRAAREQTQAELPDNSATEITAETLLNALQEGTVVHTALASLSTVQRQLIGLAFFQDMSHSEIATQVEMPIGTVKSHIRRGLQRLRQAIEL